MKNKQQSNLKNNMDLLFVLVFSILTILLVAFTPGMVRYLCSSIFLFFIPGYALISALFPDNKSLSYIERIVASFGISLAIVCITGVILNFTPGGINLWPGTILIFIFTIVFLIVSLFRRFKLNPDEIFSPSSHIINIVSDRLCKQGKSKYNFIILSIIIVFIVSFLSIIFINNYSNNELSTDFYLLPYEDNQYNFPRSVHSGENIIVRAVVINNNLQPLEYTLKVNLSGKDITSSSKYLMNNEKWDNTFSITPQNEGKDQKIEFILFTDKNDQPIDTLYIYIDVY